MPKNTLAGHQSWLFPCLFLFEVLVLVLVKGIITLLLVNLLPGGRPDA